MKPEHKSRKKRILKGSDLGILLCDAATGKHSATGEEDKVSNDEGRETRESETDAAKLLSGPRGGESTSPGRVSQRLLRIMEHSETGCAPMQGSPLGFFTAQR